MPAGVPPWPHTGAVLAGGASRRMGRPKHTLRLPGGPTMLEAVAGALAALCARVVVVGDAAGGLRGIPDLRPGLGPLGGIEALLASGLDEQYLVCPCDVPRVDAALLARLAAPSAAPATVFGVTGETGFRPLPARLAAGVLGAVRDHLDRGGRAVHEVLRALDPQVVALGVEEAAALANVNTPQDLAALTTRPRP